MHRIGIISDTHGMLRREVLKSLDGCDAIIHGGDINQQKILDKLKETAPVYAVRGNNDKEWADELALSLSFELYGVHFLVVHNKKNIPQDLTGIDIVVYGHSHKYEERYTDGRLWLNPGSCGPRRFTLPITMSLLEIGDDSSFRVKKIEIPHKRTGASVADNPAAVPLPQNIKPLINKIIKETDKGKPIKEIAGKYGVSEELTAQICRLYLTHPGVDADGIMGKMGM